MAWTETTLPSILGEAYVCKYIDSESTLKK